MKGGPSNEKFKSQRIKAKQFKGIGDKGEQ
jgi:hypothetical protein